MAKAKSKRNSTEQQLLQAVLDDPGNDTPRLVYADYLEENGDADRAEFIRTQCELETVALDHPRRMELEIRNDELLAQHRATWLGELPKYISGRGEFRRGFIEQLSDLTTTEFDDKATRIIQQVPLRFVALRGFWNEHHKPRLATREDLKQITGIAFTEAGFRTIGHFLGSSGYALTDIGLHNTNIRFDGVHSVADLPGWERVKSLQIWQYWTPFPVDSLLQSKVYHQSTEFGYTLGIASLPIEQILKAPGTAGLTHLHLSQTIQHSMKSAGGELFAASPYLSDLEFLHVGTGPFTDADAKAIAESSYLRNLAELQLAKSEITMEGFDALIHSPNLRRLTKISFTDTPTRLRDKLEHFWYPQCIGGDRMMCHCWVSKMRKQ